jgi:serine/threonine-protein kinase
MPPRLVDEGEIARGGMSAVRLVRDRHVRRRAAMKILDRGKDDPRAYIHFLREAQILGQLDHPNMPAVYDIGMTEDGTPCFIMKLVKGHTLTDVLGKSPIRAPGELGRIIEILLKVCDGLGFAHSRGVVHRDLKPDNIMVGDHGEVFVMDWGCARLLNDEELARLPDNDLPGRVLCDEIPELDKPGFVIGTGAYMAPEQATGRTDQVGPRSDVFALGAILYQVLAGRPPYIGETLKSCIEQARTGQVIPLLELDATLSPGLCRIVGKAMSLDPAGRHTGTTELARDLRRFLSGGALLESRTYAAGTHIMRVGEAADAAYIVTEGRCRIYREENGVQLTLRELGPGEVFGETGMITAQPRVANVVALTDVTATRVPKDAFADAMSLDSWTGLFVRALAERFREADEMAAELRRKRFGEGA